MPATCWIVLLTISAGIWPPDTASHQGRPDFTGRWTIESI
jgi:hypothetical protein